MKKVKVIAIGSGAQNFLNGKKARKRFDVFGIDRSDGCGNDVDKGRELAETFFEALDGFVADSGDDVIFIVSTLGGGMGSGATPVVAEHLATMDKRIVAVVTLPLAFEGKAKFERATEVVDELTHGCRKVVAINQEVVMQEQKEGTAMGRFWEIIDEEIFRTIEGSGEKKSWWKRIIPY